MRTIDIKGVKKQINKKINIEKKYFMDIRILDRKETVKEIKKLIYYAKDELILISPYIDLSDDYMDEIEYCRAVDKVLIFRNGQILKDYWFLKNNNFKLLNVLNLHSKIYINENWIIFSSMNLYNYSMENNHESSIMIRRKHVSDNDLRVIYNIIKDARRC